MKIASLLLLFVFYVSVFGRTDYTVHHEDMKLDQFDKDVISSVKLGMKNEFLSARFVLVKAVTKQWKFLIEIDRLTKNGYKRLPIKLGGILCDLLDKNFFGANRLMNENGNLTKCDIVPGTYVIDNFTPDEDKYPPFLPVSKYKIVFTFVVGNTPALRAVWYGSVSH